MDAAFVESSETGATARSSVPSLQQAKKVLSDARKNDGVGILASRMIEEALIAIRNSLENCPRHGDAHTSGREKFRAFAIAFGLPWLYGEPLKRRRQDWIMIKRTSLGKG